MSLDWKWPVSGKIYRLRGPCGINLRQRAAFSSPRSDFFTLRIFPQPVNSLLLLSLFFSSWVGGILQFCDPISSKNSSNTLPSASHPPPLFYENGEKNHYLWSAKSKRNSNKHIVNLTVDHEYKNRNTKWKEKIIKRALQTGFFLHWLNVWSNIRI